MSDMSARAQASSDQDEDVRAADPEEGITSMQNMHAQETSQAEGDTYEEMEGRS
ncbi:hypothetical protein [Kitasatospora herbaricolor]